MKFVETRRTMMPQTAKHKEEEERRGERVEWSQSEQKQWGLSQNNSI